MTYILSKIVNDCDEWPWSSYAIRLGADKGLKLSEGPVELPDDWKRLVHRRVGEEKSKKIHLSLKRGQPFGEAEWVKQVATQLGLESTLRPRGRPRKTGDKKGV